jgi:molybdopterin synthase catalytic subunit
MKLTLFPQVVVVEKMDLITSKPIDLNFLLSKAHHPEAGAVVLFSGESRISNLGKSVSHLEFESFEPLAEKMIADIVAEAISKWGLKYAFCVHRIGKVGISEPAVCILTASPHRKEAYTANQYIMHRVKHEVPIWKKEYFTDGSFAWGGNCNCVDPNKHIAFESEMSISKWS